MAEEATCKNLLQVQQKGGREVKRKRKHYSLDAVILVGYRVTRAERVASHRETIFQGHDYRQQEPLRFVLDHYVARGVGELKVDKLPQLIELKYHSLGDAVRALPGGHLDAENGKLCCREP